jgi:NAD(P)-dependent dehydrogenase (short-subunit alcohol dehydrogenase family)
MNDIRFDGRIAVVTGAGNGLGKDFALALASRGAAVVVNDLGGNATGGGGSHEAADAVVDQIRASGGRAVASYDSVASPEGGRAIAQAAIDSFGRIDILIHNAGITRPGLVTEVSKEELDAMFGAHLYGGFYVVQPCMKVMMKSGYGRIVFVSSIGIVGRTGIASYAAAKGGLIGLMNVVALEGARHGILSNALMPGALTRMADVWDDKVARQIGDTTEDGQINEAIAILRKAMKPEFVTPMTLFLCSEACQLSQSIFSATGGRYARFFMGITNGWMPASDDAPPSVADIAAHMGQIQVLEGYSVPTTVSDELLAVARSRRALLK